MIALDRPMTRTTIPHAPPVAPACRRRVRADRAGRSLLQRRGPARAAEEPPRSVAQPDGRAAAALPGPGQTGHLGLHQRRTEPGRHLGVQAGPRALARQVDARVRPVVQGHDRLLQEPGRGADEVAVPVHAPGRVAARWSPRSSRTSAGTSTRWRSSTRSSPSRTTTRRPCS